MTRSRRTLTVTEAVVRSICDAARAAGPRETGGIVLGWRVTRDIVVTDMIEIPDASAGRTHYERNHDLSEPRLCAYLNECDDPRIGYVGEWHTHPRRVGPSTLDRSTLLGIAAATADAVGLLIVAPDVAYASSSVFGFIARRGDPTSAFRRSIIVTRIIQGEADGQA